MSALQRLGRLAPILARSPSAAADDFLRECRGMPYRPNYRLERAERDRLKKAKKEEKIRQQQERAALRKTEGDDEPPPGATGDP
jgi:hypothetical protein